MHVVTHLLMGWTHAKHTTKSPAGLFSARADAMFGDTLRRHWRPLRGG